jgi:nucleotide-binding universal stress UspA family protein
MHFKRILCPVDFSDYSRAAAALAASLAKESGAELILLHSADTPIAYATDEEEGLDESLNAELQVKLAAIPLPPETQQVRRLVVEGDAGAAILDVARDERVDLIVISSHGRTGLSRLLLGSVAEYVVRNAACPVLTLKSPNVAS